jgi:hypothetical protein
MRFCSSYDYSVTIAMLWRCTSAKNNDIAWFHLHHPRQLVDVMGIRQIYKHVIIDVHCWRGIFINNCVGVSRSL